MIKIKEIPKNDVRNTIILVKSVFDYFIASDYSNDGVASFNEYICYKNMMKRYRNKNYKIYGAYCDNKLVGVIETRFHNHICLLFTHKDYQKNGIAKALINYEFENYSGNLTVNASPYAAPIYEKLGFEKVSGEIVKNGITFIPMIR